MEFNKSIINFDVSGHDFGNGGAIAIAKILRCNATLTSLQWDENNVQAPGFFAVRQVELFSI